MKIVKLKMISYSIPVLLVVFIWGEAHYSKRVFNGFDTLEACTDCQDSITEGSNIGAFNSSIIGTFYGAKNIRVFNLDGVVNNKVIPFLKNSR